MIETLIGIALLGLIVWVLVSFIPMPSQFKTLIVILAVLYVVIKIVLPMLGVNARLP